MTSSLPGSLRLVEVPEDRYEEWLDRFLGAFGHAPTGEADIVAFFRATHPPDRAIAVADEAGYVATGSAIDVDLVLPGGGTVPMAGVTGLTVDSTASRQGVLRAMMTHLHRRAADEGHLVAGLGASEWPIYGRFGYGPATWFDVLDVEARAVGWRDDAPRCELRPRRIAGKEARDLAEALHARQSSATPGEVLRPASYWDRFTLGRSSGRLDAALGLGSEDAGGLQSVAVGERGLVAYRITSRWSADATPQGTVVVTDVLATDVEAAAALWCHLLGIDLITDIRLPRVPVDDPVRWWVDDARRLRPRRHDGLWLRPLDVPQLLESRRWSGSGALTLAVHDGEGYAEGTFRLDVDAGRASCQRTSAEAELEMDAAVLGAIVLGGTSATSLARSGRIRARDPRCAQRWNALATPERGAFCSWAF